MGVRERFIESVKYLRKLGFFEEYSNLSSEEIFEKVKERASWVIPWKEEEWKKKNDFNFDTLALTVDSRRNLLLLVEWDDTFYPEQRCWETLERLSSISRGIFQPTDIEYEEIKGWTNREKEKWPEKYEVMVHFTFKSRRRTIKFPFSHEWLGVDEVLAQINRLIRDTGYQYYSYGGYYKGNGGSFVGVIVLTKREVRKLTTERGWVLYHPVLLQEKVKVLKVPTASRRLRN
ncbi:MAG: hypothetical protein QXF26_02090 [Candidatus Bathyarchaeia archaeon]